MSDIFETIYRDEKKIVIKVNADDPLTVAMHPYVKSSYAYITLTRNRAYGSWDYILTITNKDGGTFSFDWGISGYTLISNSLEELRRAVVEHLTGSRHSISTALDNAFYVED